MTPCPFPLAMSWILMAEGGSKLVNDPQDPGGVTKYGISKRAYPNIDIAALTEADATAIYLSDYWTPNRCGEMPGPIGLALFDASVNQGKVTAAKLLQGVLGVTVDGKINSGGQTVKAAQKAGAGVLVRFLTARALRYVKTPNADAFLQGWLNRLFNLSAHAAVLPW